MSYEQLLHDFVDGTLDYQGEMTLFSELQSNEGLRRELKLLMLMQKAARHDVKAFTPAPESHDAIFARLGFSPELVEEQRGRGTGGGNFGTGLAGGIIGALMVGMVVLLSGRWTRVHDDAAPARQTRIAGAMTTPRETTTERNPIASGNLIEPDNPIASGMTGEGSPAREIEAPSVALSPRNYRGQSISATASTPRPSRRGRGTSPRVSDGNGIAMASGNTDELGEGIGIDGSIASTMRLPHAGSARMLRAEPDIPATRAITASGITSPLPAPELPVISPLDDASRVSMGMRGIIGRNFGSLPAALATRSNGVMLDRAISVEYRLDVNQRIGVEAGQESFYQKFTEKLPSGDILQHEQNPAIFWGGVGFTQLFGNGLGIQPFVRGVVGGTRVGPLGRVSIGAEYDMGSDIQLMAGGEIGALAYSFDGAWFISPKYGFTYGLSMRF